MKTIRPIFKVAGIIFLLYFHLLLVTAIAYKAYDTKSLHVENSHGNPVSISPADDKLQPVLIDPAVSLREFVEPVPEPEPEVRIENWMLDAGYLHNEEEPAQAIEEWMQDPDYLDVQRITPTPEWMLRMHFIMN
jgi:hypothetical protein